MIKNLAIGVLLLTSAMSAVAETNVAVSIGQPGFYGQIVLGNPYPAPQVVYAQPVIIQPPPVAVVQQPMYLRVPPGQMKKWSRYCGHYGACGRQVYFVQDAWYQNVYAPSYVSYSNGPGHEHGYHREGRDDHRHEHFDKKGRGHGPNKGGRGRGPGRGHD
ncbi:MAG TPA: hypothetical protein VK950_02495 [Methylophilus sp.]|nr:hypothetical protein [Methylophilus sp.]